MSPHQPTSVAGALRLFRLADIAVYVHWSWLVFAFVELRFRTNSYDMQIWSVVEYLSLFGIVLLHEFGHALACRQVGGRADQIVLWPLGGIAYVQPPARPGAWLWSIAAGPLVNLVLIAPTFAIWIWASSVDWGEENRDLHQFIFALFVINLGLFIFNMLPIYPLDGGQILQSLLWFVIGRARSLRIASMIGLVGVAGFVALAVWARDWWIGVIAVFAGLRCWAGMRQANVLAQMEQAPRHQGATCPACEAAPPVGPFWQCPACRIAFDTFVHMAICPICGTRFPETQCLECQQAFPIMQWYRAGLSADNDDSTPPRS